MKMKHFFTAMMLTTTMAIAAPSFAETGPAALFPNATYNQNLASGTYQFAKTHDPSTFTDIWEFTLASNSTVSLNLQDLELLAGPGGFLSPSGFEVTPGSSNKLFDNKFLALNLFDGNGTLVGSTGENGTLSNLNLFGGQLYTLTISGKAAGLFGSAYNGTLNVASVPLSDSLPFLASALGVLILRNKKRLLSSSN